MLNKKNIYNAPENTNLGKKNLKLRSFEISPHYGLLFLNLLYKGHLLNNLSSCFLKVGAKLKILNIIIDSLYGLKSYFQKNRYLVWKIYSNYNDSANYLTKYLLYRFFSHKIPNSVNYYSEFSDNATLYTDNFKKSEFSIKNNPINSSTNLLLKNLFFEKVGLLFIFFLFDFRYNFYTLFIFYFFLGGLKKSYFFYKKYFFIKNTFLTSRSFLNRFWFSDFTLKGINVSKNWIDFTVNSHQDIYILLKNKKHYFPYFTYNFVFSAGKKNIFKKFGILGNNIDYHYNLNHFDSGGILYFVKKQYIWGFSDKTKTDWKYYKTKSIASYYKKKPFFRKFLYIFVVKYYVDVNILSIFEDVFFMFLYPFHTKGKFLGNIKKKPFVYLSYHEITLQNMQIFSEFLQFFSKSLKYNFPKYKRGLKSSEYFSLILEKEFFKILQKNHPIFSEFDAYSFSRKKAVKSLFSHYRWSL